MRSRFFVAWVVGSLVVSLLSPAMAQAPGPDKAAMVAQMQALAAQMRQLKPSVGSDAAAASQYVVAEASYRDLSRAMGGDDPGQVGGAEASAAPSQIAAAPPAPTFCTATPTTFTQSTPTAIPTGPAVVTSTVLVSGAGTYLLDVDLTTAITHTFAADLEITLQSPAGTIVTLTTDNGAGNDNVFNGTLWDDDGNAAGQVPYTTNNGVATDHGYVNLTLASPLVPEEAMGAFVGEDPNGTWTITVSDDLAGDGGSLDSWSVALTTLDQTPTTAATPVTQSTPTAIPTGPGVVTSTLVVGGAGTYLLDVNLTTFITHTFAADLDITLQSPAGTVVTLTTDNGAGNDNVFNGTVWDDDANPAGQVPYTTNNGVVTDHAFVNLTLASPLVPEEALAAFIGEDPNGTWTITISDDLAGDGGSLDSWTLNLTTATCASPNADLAITKTSDAAGTLAIGDPVIFTLTASNQGPGAATGVTVTDSLPAGLTYVSNDCGAAFASPTLTWNIGNLAASASVICNISTTTSAAGVLINSATVTATQVDPLNTNNTDQVTINVQQSVLEIPTLDTAGLALLALLLAGAAFFGLRRRRA